MANPPPTEPRELYERATKQFLDLFAFPEIKRRQEACTLPDPFELLAVQIIFFADGRSPDVRLNSEVRAHTKMKLRHGVSKNVGDPIFSDELEGLEELTLTDSEDPDCGHATIVRVNDMVFLAFDFVYNKALSAKHIASGDQFLRAAEASLQRHDMSAFVDNLFSAAELYARAILLTVGASPQFREKASHKAIHSRLNRFAALGNIDQSQASAFNTLSRLRGPARYLKAEFSLSDAETDGLVAAVKEMASSASKWANIGK